MAKLLFPLPLPQSYYQFLVPVIEVFDLVQNYRLTNLYLHPKFSKFASKKVCFGVSLQAALN